MLAEAMYRNVTATDDNAPQSVHLCPFPSAVELPREEGLAERMDVVTGVTAAALGARKQAGIKNRRPLAALVVALPTPRQAQAISDLAPLLAEAVNVKSIDLRPTGEARSAGRAEAPNYLSVADMGEGWVAVDTRIDRPLELEGLVREVVRRVQILRRDSGLAIEDRIRLFYQTENEELREALVMHRDYLARELLAIEITEPGKTLDSAVTMLDIAGRRLDVTIRRA
jgi:isoleucyl-tRNA synthetase